MIDLFIVRATPYSDGEPRAWRIGHLVAKALGMSYDDKREGIKTSGCGMDMGFHLVYQLGRVLFPQGFGEESRKLDAQYNVIDRKRAETPAHAQEMIAEGWEFHGRNGDPTGWDNDGGYALKHEWI